MPTEARTFQTRPISWKRETTPTRRTRKCWRWRRNYPQVQSLNHQPPTRWHLVRRSSVNSLETTTKTNGLLIPSRFQLPTPSTDCLFFVFCLLWCHVFVCNRINAFSDHKWRCVGVCRVSTAFRCEGVVDFLPDSSEVPVASYAISGFGFSYLMQQFW